MSTPPKNTRGPYRSTISTPRQTAFNRKKRRITEEELDCSITEPMCFSEGACEDHIVDNGCNLPGEEIELAPVTELDNSFEYSHSHTSRYNSTGTITENSHNDNDSFNGSQHSSLAGEFEGDESITDHNVSTDEELDEAEREGSDRFWMILVPVQYVPVQIARQSSPLICVLHS